MDYTLSQYKPETFEKLAHDLTVEKLVSVFGYPEVLAKAINHTHILLFPLELDCSPLGQQACLKRKDVLQTQLS